MFSSAYNPPTFGVCRLQSGHAKVTLALLLVEDRARRTWPNDLAASVHDLDVVAAVPVRLAIARG